MSFQRDSLKKQLKFRSPLMNKRAYYSPAIEMSEKRFI